MKKSLAWAGTILMLITSLVSLIISSDSDKTIWIIIAWVLLFLYSIALLILIIDYFQTRGEK
jgi:uncharacterized membrane protein YeiB